MDPAKVENEVPFAPKICQIFLLHFEIMIDPNAFPIPPEQCTLSTCSLDEAEVNYIPTLGGNITFLGIFGILLVVHTFRGIRHRTWGVLVSYRQSGLFENAQRLRKN